MKTAKSLIPIAALVVIAVAGCNQASSPATVDKDVAQANATASKDEAKALDQQAKVDSAANADVSKAEGKADDKKADSAYDVAIVQAEGAHKVAVEQCNALAGDAQKACKDQADAKLDLDKANAKAGKADHS